MARRLGEQFFHVAMGPVAMAGHCLRRGDVKQGLAELSGESLIGSVQRAVDALAATAGLPVSEVEKLLPAGELDVLAESIERVQGDAVAQWERHMAHAGGLLEAIAKLTADGRPPDAGLCLMRVATKMKLEKALAAPLRELSSLVEDWQRLLEKVRERIEQGKELERARLRRERRRRVVAGGASLLAVSVLVSIVAVTRARTRVDAALARQNPCEIELVAERDAKLANRAQRAGLDERREACRQVREEARRADERAAAAEAARRREADERRAREELCVDLGKRLATPSAEPLAATFDTITGKEGALFGRLAKGVLAVGDVTRDVAALPCLDGPGGDPIARAFAGSMVRSADSWFDKEIPSTTALALMLRGRSGIEPKALRALLELAEAQALSALTDGHRDRLDRAERRCRPLLELGVEKTNFCKAVGKKLGR